MKTLPLSIALAFCSCSHYNPLERSLDSAGPNRGQLESVLEHYRDQPEKFEAARFLIANMPGHYSYQGNGIKTYYDYAWKIISDTTLTPESQRDSLLSISDSLFSDLPLHTVPDAQIISADYLIDNIDRSYRQWKECLWCDQVRFDEWLEWMLPYKAVELQSLDSWRDSMQTRFCYGLDNPVRNDVEYGTTNGVSDLLRRQTLETIRRYGLYDRSGLPLLSDRLLSHMTFGNIPDYALLATLVMRSAGIPAVMDETPVGPRFTAATRWFVILDDRGMEQPSEWDLSTQSGWGFFPYERGPKVFRLTYAIDRHRQEYQDEARFHYPFELCRKDVTDRYFLTSDISVTIDRDTLGMLKDKYVYIESGITGSSSPWQIVDFGTISNGKARFEKMGREVLYRVLGYDGNSLIPICRPFILEKDGNMVFVCEDSIMSPSLEIFKNQAIR